MAAAGVLFHDPLVFRVAVAWTPSRMASPSGAPSFLAEGAASSHTDPEGLQLRRDVRRLTRATQSRGRSTDQSRSQGVNLASL